MGSLTLKVKDVADLIVNPATEDTLAGKFAEVTPVTGDFSTAGPNDLAVPNTGNALKVLWLYAQATAALGNGAVEVEFKLGSTSLYKFELTGSQPWAHGAVLPAGAADDKLTVTLTPGGVRVLCNADVREFTP